MLNINGIILISALLLSAAGFAQQVDSTLLAKYPLVIGNLGIATDSVEIVVGDAPRGETSTFQYEIFNLGNDIINISNGRSNKFINIESIPSGLAPGSSAILTVEFDAKQELELGDFDVEVSLITDDAKNPYKFMTLLMNIVEGTNPEDGKFDSIPHVIFDHYNHDFGHLKRGKVLYHTFILENNGGEPLYIYSVEPPKGITVVDYPQIPVMPGEKSIIRLKINTRGRVGVQHNSVFVKTNDPESNLIILGLHGSVKVYPDHKKTENQCGEGRNNF
jgi:hypothetical protein